MNKIKDIDDFCRRMKVNAKTKIDISLLVELLDKFSDEQLNKNLNMSDISDIDSPSVLTKKQILSCGDWLEADYVNLMEGYYWKHKNKKDDGYSFYMRRYNTDGLTEIIEEGRVDNKLFEGYIKNISELNQIVHLIRLKEI